MSFHDDEVETDLELVHQLIQEQCPQFADQPLQLLASQGTDNVLYKLGHDKLIRLPRTEGAVHSLEKEAKWLPALASHLPIPIPPIVQRGHPAAHYPFPWLIITWLEGSSCTEVDLQQAACDLGAFVRSMHQIPTARAPLCARGQPLHTRDTQTRHAIEALQDLYDQNTLLNLWEKALAQPQWEKAPLWIHGDLHPGNLLVQNNKISAVLDFGLMGVGDPACDLMVAWTLLDDVSRATFRKIVQPDEATWARGRGWALTLGLVAYPYYRKSHPAFAAIAKRAIDNIVENSDF